MYSDPTCTPCFSATNGRPQDMYYDVERSVELLTTLLQFQFQHEELAIFDFLQKLFDVIDKRSVKCNSILVYSPPSGGKNFFFDTIMSFLLNKGQMGNPNKNTSFAYQECAGKRVLLWNEPNYEASEVDKLKMILGGDQYTVPVKCRMDVAVQKTPVIILTNKVVGLMVHAAFEDRIAQYRWRTAPFLKDYNKKPHPMSIYYLFKNYSIQMYINFIILLCKVNCHSLKSFGYINVACSSRTKTHSFFFNVMSCTVCKMIGHCKANS